MNGLILLVVILLFVLVFGLYIAAWIFFTKYMIAIIVLMTILAYMCSRAQCLDSNGGIDE